MGNILLVEDSRTVTHEIRTLFENQGHDVTHAGDGLAALRMIQEDIDVMVVDIGLPGINGIDLCITIRKMPGHADTPIVIITGKARPGDRRLARSFGAKAFLKKPVDHDDLMAAVDASLSSPDEVETA